MRRHSRVFTEGDRETFIAAIGVMRRACIEVHRQTKYGSHEYRVAHELKTRLDDAVEALTGDRERFWLKPHSCPAPPDGERS